MAGRKPGTPKTGGRQRGTPNKVTTEFRETVRKLLEDNSENIFRWLTLVAEGDGSESAKPNPAKALDIITGLAEYVAPKQSRVEAHVSTTEQSHEEWLDGLK